MPTMTRRIVAAGALTAIAAAGTAFAQDEEVYEGHAFAMHGDVKYGPDFEHWDYVNPDAPKGGTMRLGGVGGFDSLNPFIIQGTVPFNPLVIYTMDTLMVSSSDEPFTEYCLICETVRVPADRGWVEFDLNPDAKFADGTPITVDDVIWSFEAWTTHFPRDQFYYADVESVSQVGEHTVRFDFSTNENLELPLILGQLRIMSKDEWAEREITRVSLDPYISSGAYIIAEVDPGRRIVFERNPDYWAADLPVMRGMHNIDRIVFDYYLDADVAFEAFKSGDIDYRTENTSKNWATGYDIPEVEAGVIVKEELENELAEPFQGLFFNLRRPQFADRRVREALILAFDFEWTNENLFYSLYQRTDSLFEASELEASGPPSPEELAVLEPFRDQLQPEVFELDYEAPSTAETGLRANLRRAVELLEEAGYVMEDGVRVHQDTGTRLEMEILLVSPSFERIMLPYATNLQRIGVAAEVRTVETSQYVERLNNFDFDAVNFGIAQSLSPGNEQRDYWGSGAADTPGSRNVMGLANPAIDALIDLVIQAPTREDLVIRTRALDRAVIWEMFAVPEWNNPTTWVAYWDQYDHPRPDEAPSRGVPFTAWWYDAEKAATLADRRAAARQ